MAKETLNSLLATPDCSIYEIAPTAGSEISRFVASTALSRDICNDPFLAGVAYTEALRDSCALVLSGLAGLDKIVAQESSSLVFNVLRGGLNFCLRESLAQAFSWNNHASAFISAQRSRNEDDPESWSISESGYRKVYLPKVADVFLGEVVATGTTLSYFLELLNKIAAETRSEIRSLVVFTIGGSRTEDALLEFDTQARKKFPSYLGSSVVYLEGRFEVATPDAAVTVKHTGTDLLRRDSILSPEFLKSQYENPTFPLERCTIYDAGSRAFWLPEYFADVQEYWEKTQELASGGMSFVDLLAERFPELDSSRFGSVDLVALCREQLQKVAKSDVLIARGE